MISNGKNQSELIIDKELSELLPPLPDREFYSLERSILNYGYIQAYPILVWKGKGIIVDGKHRFKVCKKHNIPFTVYEQEFESKYAVASWILNNQQSRRNINSPTRVYIWGRSCLIEKKESLKTIDRIAEQLHLSTREVERAAQFTLALDAVVANTGIQVNDILNGMIPSTQQSAIDLAELDIDSQKRVIELILHDERDTVELAINAVKREIDDQRYREAEEKRKIMDEQLKQERETKEKQKREKLRLAREKRDQL